MTDEIEWARVRAEVYEDCVIIHDDNYCVTIYLSEEMVDAIVQRWLKLRSEGE